MLCIILQNILHFLMHLISFQHTFLKSTPVYVWYVGEFKAEDKQTWRQHAQLLLSTLIPLTFPIVWEIPRVQRVRYILLIDAGTSLQQIHKLKECDLTFSSFNGILNWKVVLTPRSISTGLKTTWQACCFSQCYLKIFFIFFKRCCTWFRSQM